MLETCGVLQCERLYLEIIKEAQEKLGADEPVTTKVYRNIIYTYDKYLRYFLDCSQRE